METLPPQIENLLRLAKEDLARNSLLSAERHLEQAILMNNQVAESFYLLGHVYSKRGKFKKAILALERALSIDPFHTECAIALSGLYNDVGKYDKGAQVFNRTKKRLEHLAPGFDPRINQKLAKRHYDLGLMYMQFERFAEAHTEFTKALELEPTEPTYVIHIAKCMMKAENRSAAEKLLRKCVERHPQNVEAHLQLGILYFSQKRLAEARKHWQEASSIDPENRSVQMYLKMLRSEPTVNRSYPETSL